MFVVATAEREKTDTQCVVLSQEHFEYDRDLFTLWGDKHVSLSHFPRVNAKGRRSGSKGARGSGVFGLVWRTSCRRHRVSHGKRLGSFKLKMLVRNSKSPEPWTSKFECSTDHSSPFHQVWRGMMHDTIHRNHFDVICVNTDENVKTQVIVSLPFHFTSYSSFPQEIKPSDSMWAIKWLGKKGTVIVIKTF